MLGIDEVCTYVVPIMILINGQCSGDESSSKDRRVNDNQLPQRGMMVGEYLELGIQIEV